ncbi:hypothetical protein C8R45DRAFT_1189214 [Mycena sanguinolenta]|nr:hypothetical protein C8R45DRAFT_1189214 [Mycena sanguinolenta]
MTNATELPNPSNPLVFLPPALASELEVSHYLHAATLGAYLWDIGSNLGNDYTLLLKHRVRFPTTVYFISRAFTLAYILTIFVCEGCQLKTAMPQWLASKSASYFQTSTALLFFLRVTEVWYPNRIAYVVFLILWMAVLGAGITVPLGVHAAYIGPTQCIITTPPAITEVAAIMPLINDTAIFLAINYRILAHTIAADSSMARLRVFLGGKALSTLSQALLQTGQHFYLIAVVTQIILLVLLKLPYLSPVYRTMVAVPGLALINAVACLVFRRIKFGLISPDGISKISTTGLSVDFHATANPRSHPLQFHHTDPSATGFGSNTAFPLEVCAQREIDKFDGADACEEISKPTDFA